MYMSPEPDHLLRIGDGGDWHFLNGQWEDAADDGYHVVGDMLDDDGRGLQCYRFAFNKSQALTDFRARFEVRHNNDHNDIGLIFRATDPQHFYVLHFTCCNQAIRAQNYWVALSRMDSSGVLRIIKLDYVRRVASQPRGQWHDVELHVTGSSLRARIDGRGTFEADGLDDLGPGCVGLMSFREAQIRRVSISGTSTAVTAWSDEDRRQRHWFHPCPEYRARTLAAALGHGASGRRRTTAGHDHAEHANGERFRR
jgi:hypothetical protein